MVVYTFLGSTHVFLRVPVIAPAVPYLWLRCARGCPDQRHPDERRASTDHLLIKALLQRLDIHLVRAVATLSLSMLGSRVCIKPAMCAYSGCPGPAPMAACADNTGAGRPAAVKVACSFIPRYGSAPERCSVVPPHCTHWLNRETAGSAPHPDQSASWNATSPPGRT